MNKFTYLSSNTLSTENDSNIHETKLLTAIDWLSIIWKFGLSDEIKRDFFQAVATV